MTTSTDTTRLTLGRSSRGGCRVGGGGGAFRAVQEQVGRDWARVALVPDRALLLAGDDVRLEVEVEPGLRLELVETGGTVAYDMRGDSARWSATFTIGAGARLVHETLPWVSAAGSDVVRETRVDLAPSGGEAAGALLRETVVLGRHGEQPGRLVSHLHVRRDGLEVLVEELHAEDLAPHRVIDQVAAYGLDPSPAAEVDSGGITRLDLADPAGVDTVWRRLDDHAHVAAAGLDRIFAALRD